METPIHNEEHKGARWRYGCVYRPPQYGAVPRGRIIGADKPDPRYRHGTIEYAAPLDARDAEAHELQRADACLDCGAAVHAATGCPTPRECEHNGTRPCPRCGAERYLCHSCGGVTMYLTEAAALQQVKDGHDLEQFPEPGAAEGGAR
jgi:hypothetical protein